MKRLRSLTGLEGTQLTITVAAVTVAELLLLGGYLAYVGSGRLAAWVGALVVALGINVLTGVLINRSLIGRIRRLRETTDAIASGDLERRTPTSGRDEHGDELDQLARQINAIAGLINGPVEDLSDPSTDDPRETIGPTTLRKSGFAATLQDLVEQWKQQTEISITVDILADPDFGGDVVEQSLRRVTTEALDNLEQHAHAANAAFRLEADAREIRMTIADDGGGFDPGIQETMVGSGLRDMRNWMREADGLLLIQTAPDRGTTIQAIIPISTGQSPSGDEESRL